MITLQSKNLVHFLKIDIFGTSIKCIIVFLIIISLDPITVIKSEELLLVIDSPMDAYLPIPGVYNNFKISNAKMLKSF